MRLCKNCGVKERKSGRTARYCIECAIKIKLEKHRIADRNYVQRHKERVLVSRSRRDREPLAKLRYARFRSTEKYREYCRNRYNSLDKNQKAAWIKSRNAIRDGKLARPDNCEKCGVKNRGVKRSMIEGHHYLGYKPDHWLDIRWLCVDCHKQAHRDGVDAQC